jgi:hypothetical protein
MQSLSFSVTTRMQTEDGAVLVGYGPNQSAFDSSDIKVVQKEVFIFMTLLEQCETGIWHIENKFPHEKDHPNIGT